MWNLSWWRRGAQEPWELSSWKPNAVAHTHAAVDDCSLLQGSSEVEDGAVTGNGRWKKHSCSSKGAATPPSVTGKENWLGLPVSNIRQQKKAMAGLWAQCCCTLCLWIHEPYDAISPCLSAEEMGTYKWAKLFFFFLVPVPLISWTLQRDDYHLNILIIDFWGTLFLTC